MQESFERDNTKELRDMVDRASPMIDETDIRKKSLV